MKNVSMRVWLHVVALALAGLPLLTLPTLASAQDSATVSSSNFNPPPCDYNDTFYEDNGIIPTQVVGRFGTSRRTGPPAGGNGVNWVADSNCAAKDPDRRNFRILATTGGFSDNGTNAPNQFISILGFLTSESAFETTYSRLAGTHDVSISNSENPRGITMQNIVSNFEAYAMVKQRQPNGVFATNPCNADIASPLAPPTPCFELNTVNTVFTPNLRQDWRFASNRNAMDGSDNNCISTDPTVCANPSDSPFGYFCDDLLGMWIITYVWLTQDPAHPTTAICASVFAALEAKNGVSLDGGPIIVTADDTNNQIEANGCGAEGKLAVNGTDGGAIWLICPAIPDPRNGAIARDAFLDQVFLPNGQPQNPTMTANFVSLQTTGQFPGGGDGSVPGSP
jgi:hypothetical protein